MSDLKRTPNFNDPNEASNFWDTHDSAEYVDWSQAESAVFPNLKPSTTSISLRLPAWMLARIRELANIQDVPYQSLIKVYIGDCVERELAIIYNRHFTYRIDSHWDAPTSTVKTRDSWLYGDAHKILMNRKTVGTFNNSGNKV